MKKEDITYVQDDGSVKKSYWEQEETLAVFPTSKRKAIFLRILVKRGKARLAIQKAVRNFDEGDYSPSKMVSLPPAAAWDLMEHFRLNINSISDRLAALNTNKKVVEEESDD